MGLRRDKEPPYMAVTVSEDVMKNREEEQIMMKCT